MRHLNKNRTIIQAQPLHVERKIDKTIIEIALQYNDGVSETLFSFANGINTVDGGSHVTGFRAALTRTLNEYGRKTNLLKENDTNFTGDDVREGLTTVISVKLPEAQFEGQTKGKLNNAEVRNQVGSGIGTRSLAKYLEETPSEAQAHHREMPDGRARARSRAQGARAGAPQRCARLHSPRQAGGLLRASAPSAASSTWSRAIPQAAPQSRAATGTSRRSCRYAARF